MNVCRGIGLFARSPTWKESFNSLLPIVNPVRSKYKLKTRKACAKRFTLKRLKGTRTKLSFRPKQHGGTENFIENPGRRWHFKKMLPYY